MELYTRSSHNVHGGPASQWDTRAASEVKQREARQTRLSANSGKTSKLSPVLPSIHNPPSYSSSPLLLSFPFPSLLPQSTPSSRVTTSEPYYHNVQKRSAAIQPRRCGCLCHWPDRFGEFFFFSMPSISHPIPKPPRSIPSTTHFPMSGGGLPSCYSISMGFLMDFSTILFPFLLRFDTLLPVGCDIDKILRRLGSRCRPRRRLPAVP